jgi:hypothetical protein
MRDSCHFHFHVVRQQWSSDSDGDGIIDPIGYWMTIMMELLIALTAVATFAPLNTIVLLLPQQTLV